MALLPPLSRQSSHWRFVEDAELNPHNSTHHHVVLAIRSRGMVSYKSLLELLIAPQELCIFLKPPYLNNLGVDHRDANGGNILLGTDPEKALGFIPDLCLSSTSREAAKAACPNRILRR